MEVIRQKPNERIKEASKQSHQQLEKKMVSILKAIRNKQDYFYLLNIFYNYFSELESKIDVFVTADILPDYTKRRKAERIANDIKALGFEPLRYAQVETPSIETPLEAIAALYVMEGSTLGGAHIVKMLAQKNIAAGISFFSGYGSQTLPMWQHFTEVLNTIPATEADDQTLINTVNTTFSYFYLLFMNN